MNPKPYSRREFIRTTASVAGGAIAVPSLVSSRALGETKAAKPAALRGDPVRTESFPE